MLTYVMKILAIDTSCDDTCASVLDNDRIITNVVSSQIEIHKAWGGVVPNLAKRAHEEKIDAVIEEALKVNPLLTPPLTGRGINLLKNIDVIGVTVGPGLSPALGVGVDKAKELAKKYKKKLVAVNHIEAHLLSVWLKDEKGEPDREIELPALALTVSGGHTKIVGISCLDIASKHHPDFQYKVVGETLDDASGEALDKAAKLLELGYPGGPIIEKMAKEGKADFLKLPIPMKGQKGYDLSFSGLKTAFYYAIKDWPKEKVEENKANLAASFQKAVFDSLINRFEKAVEEIRPKSLIGVGGVMNNEDLRYRLLELSKKRKMEVYFPYSKALNGDNAAMVGMVAYTKALRGEFVEDIEKLDREPRLEIRFKTPPPSSP